MERFIQICGYPRSGTSFCQHLVGAHPDVYISGEVGRMVFPEIVSLLKRATVDYGELGGQTAKLWDRRRPRLVRDLFVAASKYAESHEEALARPLFGNKMPRAERFWLELERALRPMELRFVYCLRDPEKAIQSKQNMHRTARDFEHSLSDYEKSIASLLQLREKRADRLFIFSTEQYQREPRLTLERLMNFVGVTLTSAQEELMLATPARNTSAQQMAARREHQGAEVAYVELDAGQRERISASGGCRQARAILDELKEVIHAQGPG